MKKLLLAAALVAAPLAVSAETVVLEGRLGERAGIAKFYDSISHQYCIALQYSDGITLQCMSVESLYNSFEIEDLVKKKKAEQAGN